MRNYACRLAVALLCLLGLATGSAAQAPQNSPAQAPQNSPATFGKFGPTYTPSLPPTAPPVNTGAPLFGQAWPQVGPSPAPQVGPPSRCPPGYVEPSGVIRVPHIVVCTVLQSNFMLSQNGASSVAQPYPNLSYPVQAVTGQPMSSLLPGPEQAIGAHCNGRSTGTYACGRGGTECCSANQDNPCFPGAYACSLTVGAGGAKTACCMNR